MSTGDGSKAATTPEGLGLGGYERWFAQVPNNAIARVRLKRVSATSFERVATAGSATETATWTVSRDGKTLTVVTKGVDALGMAYSSTQVFTRQE